MDRRSTTGMLALLTAALAFAVWGCGGSSPHYQTSDGGGQHDAGETGDGGRDAAKHDAAPRDGAEPDGGSDGRLVDWDAFNPGPTITFLSPASGASVKPSISFKFTAEDADGLKAQAPVVLIDGNPVTLTPALDAPADGENAHTWTAEWTIPAPPALGGLGEGTHTIAAKAWDTGDREGVGGINFTVDRTGPTITPIAPLAGTLVGGTVRFQATIEDGAGIDETSVTLEIMQAGPAGGGLVIRLLRADPTGPATGGVFYYDYDTANLPTSLIFPQLLWRAYDRLGNERHVAYEIAVDNTPPSVSLAGNPTGLDPPQDVYPAKYVPCWPVCGQYGCESDLAEDATKCPHDCGPVTSCGDGACQAGETGSNCPADCAATCGNGTCQAGAGETKDNCPADCHTCGDGVCHYPAETCTNCPADCGQCRQACHPDGTLLMCARPIDPLMNYMPVVDTTATPASWAHVRPEGTVPQAMYLRARVVDFGNRVAGATVIPLAGIDDTKVRLYILPRDDRALVVADADGGTCTGINPDLKEVGAVDLLADPNNVLVLDMAPVTPGGEADFRVYSRTAETPALCDVTGDATVPMTKLPALPCEEIGRPFQAPFAIHPQDQEGVPGIYTLPFVKQGDPYFCEGTQYDAYQLPDGWFCAAVSAEDTTGNRAVSQPLHLCLDKSWSGGGACPMAPSTHTCVAVESDPAHSPTAHCQIARPFASHQVLESKLLR